MNKASEKRGALPLLALFLVALIVRCIGLQWGLPNASRWYSYHPDELQMFAAISSLDFFGGDFNPNFFNYPSLYIYLSYIAHLAFTGFGLGYPPPTQQSQAWMAMHDVLLSARLVTAVLGAATVPLVFLITRQIATVKAGVLAALLLAFAPGVVQHSHFATVDVPAIFFLTLSLWLSTLALREDTNPERQQRALLLAAFAAGLAAATKYNAGLIIVAPLIAALYLRRSIASRVLLPTIIGVGAIGFLIGCPFAIFDFPSFWGDGKNSGLSYELLMHPKQGHGDVFIGTGNGWIYHAFFNAPFLMTLPLLLAAVAGIVQTRIVRRRETCMLFTFFALYCFALGFSQVRFMRYLLPIAPTLCIFAVAGVLCLRRPPLKLVVGAILCTVAALSCFGVLSQFVATDPRDHAAQWMKENANTPATVGMIDAPWFYSPPLSPLDSPPFRRLSPEQLFELSGNKYRFAITGFDAKKLTDERPEWFIISEFEWREKARLQDAEYLKFRETLEREYSLAASFKNRALLPGRAFVPHDFLYPNPEIRIYKKG